MRALVLEALHQPLVTKDMPVPTPGADQVVVEVEACGVCRTDLHIVDGELEYPKLPLILGHEIVGRVVIVGASVTDLQPGTRVGIPWLGWTDRTCRFCQRDQENLCPNARFTGYQLDGGYAQYVLAHAAYCLPLQLPRRMSSAQAAPLLCAGLIGYRTWRLAGPHIERLGIYGFGAAAHIVTQVAVSAGQRVYAFTRPGDVAAQEFARRLGAAWAGGSDQQPPQRLDAALLFAPIGSLVPTAMEAVMPGGVVVCGGIHMSDIPSFPYRLLWQERVVRSVANLTRRDGHEFLRLVAQVPIETTIEHFLLQEANEALDRLRSGRITGAAVLDLMADR
jgi:alcohol dehydrogenase, propanol-preferring